MIVYYKINMSSAKVLRTNNSNNNNSNNSKLTLLIISRMAILKMNKLKPVLIEMIITSPPDMESKTFINNDKFTNF